MAKSISSNIDNSTHVLEPHNNGRKPAKRAIITTNCETCQRDDELNLFQFRTTDGQQRG